MKIIQTLKSKNISSGWLYFYIHFVTEIICFYVLTSRTGDSILLWSFPLVYDTLAFVPQSLIGRISDTHPKIPFALIGILLLAASGTVFWLLPNISPYIPLVFLCIGNAFVHVNGARVTLTCSDGKLSHSAIFVSGGSFGVALGRASAAIGLPFPIIILTVLTAVPFVLLAEFSSDKNVDTSACKKFNYINKKLPPAAVVAIAVFVVMIRAYMGYGIPTTWKKTMLQTIIFYFAMGLGKALGGILSDTFGIRKTAVLSALFALPFLFAGDDNMYLSIIGVMLFSMTMAVTLAMLVSVLKKSPGLAFGWTTLGLFAGSAPIFFLRISTKTGNCIMLTVLTLLSVILLAAALRKDGKNEYIHTDGK